MNTPRISAHTWGETGTRHTPLQRGRTVHVLQTDLAVATYTELAERGAAVGARVRSTC